MDISGLRYLNRKKLFLLTYCFYQPYIEVEGLLFVYAGRSNNDIASSRG